ncbi:MAG: hypothetical protein OEM67_04400 [Thermoleophilia bacterium]|nr:hypothetical protein [Thermoleophilia bacterium]MDH3725058.1 hypothetical protein [Thermoleophilia bacterium]
MSLAFGHGRRALIGVVILAMLAFAPFAFATKGSSTTEDVSKLRGGFTEVTLSQGAAAALAGNPGNPIDVAPAGEAYATKTGAIRFPITRGQIKAAEGLNAVNLAGQIRHAGGLKFTGRTSGSMLVLDRYHINLDKNPDLSARVNGMGPDRIELFDVDFSTAEIGSEKGKTVVSGVQLNLSAAAAAALKATYGVEIAPGTEVGTATVKTYARPRTVKVPAKLRLYRGWTTVALDPGTAGVLTENRVAVAPVGMAKAGVSGISFPITWGKVATDLSAGRIAHGGGLSLTAGETTVTLKRFVIDLKTGQLSGVVFVGDQRVGRIPLFTLDPGEAEVVLVKGFHRVTNVKLALTQGAADALNGVFFPNGPALFAKDLAIGTAKVRARTSYNHYTWWHRSYKSRHK